MSKGPGNQGMFVLKTFRLIFNFPLRAVRAVGLGVHAICREMELIAAVGHTSPRRASKDNEDQSHRVDSLTHPLTHILQVAYVGRQQIGRKARYISR